MRFGPLDGRDDGELSSRGFVVISEIFATKDEHSYEAMLLDRA